MTRSGNRAIVIGSGFGGLASAVRLRARGWDVTVLEANDQAGGRASVFKRDGFTFDAGPTVITAPYLLDELFELVGRRREDYFQLVPVDPFYRIEFHDGSRFDYVGDEERLLANIRAINPRDVDNYQRLVAKAKEIFDIGYMQLADRPFDRISEMLRVIPDMIRLSSYKSVYGLVASFMEDERLRQVFTFQPLLVGGNPFQTSSIYMLIHWLERQWGVHYALGGTTAIVGSLTRLLTELGVEIRLNAPVAEIEVNASGAVSGVRLENGETIEADLVVSNADPSVVYTKMVAAKHRKKYTDGAIARRRQSMSLFVAYFGTKKTYEDIAHHTIILGPRYEGLLNDIFNKRILAEDFSLYLHAPTRSDKSMAPDGNECFYVLSPVPNEKSGIDWEAQSEEYLDRILTFLDRTHLPGLKDNLATSFSVDPRYFSGRLRSMDGAAFGLEPRLTQSAYFRYHNKSDDVTNLFFAGASTHPGAGVPGVLCGAKVLEHTLPELPAAQRIPLPLGERSRARKVTTALEPGSLAREAAFAEAVATLSAGSKTFRLASRLLPPEALGWGAIVYRFCRRVDDAVDEAPSADAASAAVTALRAELDGAATADAPMQLFAQFCAQAPVLHGAALALMEGVESDLTPARFESDDELLRYAYGVAGTVGLMMCGVIGVRDPEAYPHAIDLGVAMQLTNICRDVADDAALDRRYLPAARLRAAGIAVGSTELAIESRDSDAIAAVLRELLDLAERYYASAEAGMRYIPWKTRVAMIVAARLYRQIGHKLRRKGARFESGRTVVGAFEKAVTLLRALIACCGPTIAGYGQRRRHDPLLHRALAGLPGTAA